MDDAGELAALAGNHRNDKAVVAEGDVFFLEHAFVAVGAQEAFERFLNGFFLLLDFAADAMEMRAGAVEHGSVGADFAFDFFEQRAEIANAAGAGVEQREAFGGRGEERGGVGGAVEECDEVEDFAGFKRRAFDMQLAYGGGDVGQPGEADADGRALAGGLRGGGGAHVTDGFIGFGEKTFEARAIVVRFDQGQFGGSQRAADVTAEQRADLLPFEDVGAGEFHRGLLSTYPKAFAITGRVPAVIFRSASSAWVNHAARPASSAAQSSPPAGRQR